ncbi:hypothetical protein Thermo_00091 [Thermoplasmatales archaeon]|nr:hypothetical protein Thermo_00091 [Thermoplasmatales archaeon]
MVFKKGHDDFRKNAVEGGYARDLMKNEAVKLWYENLRRKSDLTAGVYLRGLNYYCKRMDTDPNQILTDAGTDNGDKLQRDFMKFVSIMEKEGKKGAYIVRYKKVIHSWTRFNAVKFHLIANIANENINENVQDERVPTNEELGKMLRKAGLRERVSISMMAFSGLRPQVLGNNEGKDGLRLKDVPEIEIMTGKDGMQTVRATKDILLINVRFNLSKKRFRYHTFLCEEGVRYLLEYLEDRIRSKEVLTDESPILQYDQESKREHEVLGTHYLTKAIREVVRSTGFEWRPYVFRAYFATGMDIAESKGVVSHSWRQHWMGHIGDIESKYSTNKKLPDDILERMRESYAKASRFLETEDRGISEKQHEDEINAVKIMMLKLAGYTDEEIEKQGMLDMDISDLVKKFDEKRSRSMNNGNSQKVISFKEVETYIEQGWEYVRDFPGNKAIVKLPS